MKTKYMYHIKINTRKEHLVEKKDNTNSNELNSSDKIMHKIKIKYNNYKVQD